jgi:hypothetical protein
MRATPIGLVSLVVSLVLGGLLFAAQWGGSGGGSGNVDKSRPVEQANMAAASVAAAQAEHLLADYQAGEGTFVGADLSPVPGTRLVRADATSYCFEIATNGVVLYDHGPAGGPTSQPC